MAKHATPLLDQLESGPWPSFVSDMKQQAEVRAKNAENIEFQIPQDVVEDLHEAEAKAAADRAAREQAEASAADQLSLAEQRAALLAQARTTLSEQREKSQAAQRETAPG